jgi:hypothetical protein
MVGLDAVFGGSAIGHRATGNARAWHEQAAEPRPERGVGVRRRLCADSRREQKGRREEKARHDTHQSKSHA